MDEIVTSDLSRFGHRELKMAKDILDACCKSGFPDGFSLDEVQIVFNTHSGDVFLANTFSQVVELRGDRLEERHFCPYCYNHGFADEIGWNSRYNCCDGCVEREFSIHQFSLHQKVRIIDNGANPGILSVGDIVEVIEILPIEDGGDYVPYVVETEKGFRVVVHESDCEKIEEGEDK